MIRNISYGLLDNKHLKTDILIRFEDKGINKDCYDFINERLEDFKLNSSNRYSITIDSKYDCSTYILSIQIVLSIPNNHKPLDAELEQIINHISYKFIKFYEKNIQIINSKNNNGDKY